MKAGTPVCTENHPKKAPNKVFNILVDQNTLGTDSKQSQGAVHKLRNHFWVPRQIPPLLIRDYVIFVKVVPLCLMLMMSMTLWYWSEAKGRAGPCFYEGVIIKTHSLCTLLTSSNLILFFMRRREGPLALENMMASNFLPELHMII